MLFSEVPIKTIKKDIKNIDDLLIKASVFELKNKKINVSYFALEILKKFFSNLDVINFDIYENKIIFNKVSIDKKDAMNTFNSFMISLKNIFDKLNVHLNVIQDEYNSVKLILSKEHPQKSDKRFLVCNLCSYSVDSDFLLPYYKRASTINIKEIESVYTPNIKSIEDLSNYLKISKKNIIKTLIFSSLSYKIVVLCRGDKLISKKKLEKYLKEKVKKEKEIYIEKILGLPLGFIGPVGLDDYLVLADCSLRTVKNAICGANIKNYHYKNVNLAKDFNVDAIVDLSLVEESDTCPLCKQGNFYESYGDEVSKFYIKENINNYEFNLIPFLKSLLNNNIDKKGIILNKLISPWDIIITLLNKNQESFEKALKLEKDLEKENISCLIDDRNLSSGVKLYDSELLGIPLRVSISSKSNDYELYLRKEDKKFKYKFTELKENIIQKLKEP